MTVQRFCLMLTLVFTPTLGCSEDSSSSSGSSAVVAPEDASTSEPEDAMVSTTVDAGREAPAPSNCPTCNAGGYSCFAPAAGATVQLNTSKQADGSCKLNNGKISLACGGMGTAADGSPYPWVEGKDGMLQMGTGDVMLQCTPK